jgi:opacity protein-like surface antigen
MKKFLLPVILFFALSAALQSQSKTSFGFNAGVALPNDAINRLTDDGNITLSDTSFTKTKALIEDSKTGYFLTAKLRFAASSKIHFFGGFSWYSFGTAEFELEDIANGEIVGKYESQTNYVPLSAGVNYYLVQMLADVYLVGELNYNYKSTSINIIEGISEIPNDISDNRLGFGLGAGVDIGLGEVKFNVEAKYHQMNFIGAGESEDASNIITLGVGFFF